MSEQPSLDVFENRVRMAETDQEGVVFYGSYVTGWGRPCPR